ncbi:terminase small subunit [Leuconostoc fallax]|nr:terminase small subunit [Leuconostoc fallax]
MDKLTTKQKRFCEEYVKLGNATKAYQVAGLKEVK